jgi:hypothetical protein
VPFNVRVAFSVRAALGVRLALGGRVVLGRRRKVRHVSEAGVLSEHAARELGDGCDCSGRHARLHERRVRKRLRHSRSPVEVGASFDLAPGASLLAPGSGVAG